MARRRSPSRGHAARDGGARLKRVHRRDPRADTRPRAAANPEGAPARSLSRTRARRRCTTPKARQRGPSGGQAGDGDARPRGHTSLAPQADSREGYAVPEGSSAAPQEDTRAMAARYLESASTTRWAGTRATAAADPEGAPARPLRRTRARRRRLTPRAARFFPMTFSLLPFPPQTWIIPLMVFPPIGCFTLLAFSPERFFPPLAFSPEKLIPLDGHARRPTPIAASDLDGAAARPLWQTRARRFRSTWSARQRCASGGHTRVEGTRH